MSKKFQYVCPACGEGDAISERNIAHILYTVRSWTESGEPDDFGDREILDDTMRITNQGDDGHDRFVCSHCNHEFEEPVKITTVLDV